MDTLISAHQRPEARPFLLKQHLCLEGEAEFVDFEAIEDQMILAVYAP